MRRHLILRVVTKVLTTPIILFGFYVQFHGDYGPGGGFQAGVIIAAAFILYGLIFGLTDVQRVLPEVVARILAGVGVLLYAGVGYASFFFGGEFLNYSVFFHHVHEGQHLGILLVELGVLTTVASVMVLIFYAFASRNQPISDEDW
jgi:multicomponent Na+:H+ antiporter subunit B